MIDTTSKPGHITNPSERTGIETLEALHEKSKGLPFDEMIEFRKHFVEDLFTKKLSMPADQLETALLHMDLRSEMVMRRAFGLKRECQSVAEIADDLGFSRTYVYKVRDRAIRSFYQILIRGWHRKPRSEAHAFRRWLLWTKEGDLRRWTNDTKILCVIEKGQALRREKNQCRQRAHDLSKLIKRNKQIIDKTQQEIDKLKAELVQTKEKRSFIGWFPRFKRRAQILATQLQQTSLSNADAKTRINAQRKDLRKTENRLAEITEILAL